MELFIAYLKKHSSADYVSLATIGGERAVEFMVASLRDLRQAVRRRGVEFDSDLRHVHDTDDMHALSAYRACRMGIERGAGRTFANDEEISQWWKEAKGQSQRQWLEANLQRTAIEADQGNAKAQFILRQIAPNLPNAEEDVLVDFNYSGKTYSYRERPLAPYRAAWIAEHRGVQ